MHVFLLTSLVLGMVGCDSEALEDGAGDVATTQTPTAPPPPANVEVPMPELPEGHTVAVSVELSKIQFTGAKFTGSHDGGFGQFDGAVVVSDDQVLATEFEIDLAVSFSECS